MRSSGHSLWLLVKSVLHNVGVVLVGLGVAYLGTKVDSFVGIAAFSSTLAKAGGVILLVLGFLVRLWATYHFYGHKMRVISLEPQSTLITSGPYRFSRNPLYLGGNVFIFFGAALLLGSAAALIFTVMHLPLVDRFIRREERQLEATFGDEWRSYKGRVRRWLKCPRVRFSKVAVGVGLAALAGFVPIAAAQATDAVNPAELAAFVDSLMAAEMAREQIPGAGFVFVQNGRVLYQRGYGLANVAQARSSVPDSTIWRIGSISKLFTVTAVMQLVDRGLIDLDAPVERYVRRIRIPHAYPDSVTVRQLLTHTAGFDEIRPGTQAATADSVLPLDRFLQMRLIQVRPPGRTIAYSTYGITLAGEMVEEVSGLPFETFLRRNIWDPLGMTRTMIDLPPGESHVAKGYEIEGDSMVAQPWEWYHTTPASSVNATVADMSRFLMANLGLGATGGARILSERSASEMQRQQITMDPAIPGYALGFNEDYVGDLRVLEHGGNMAGFSSLMLLIPTARTGFFVVNHLEGSQLRDNLKWSLLERFFPAARERHPVPATLPPIEQVQPARFAGKYIPLTSCFSCQPIRAGSVMTVGVNDDGTLAFAGGRWVAADSLRFVKDGGTGYIVFRSDNSGSIRELFAGGFWGWQKLPDE